MTDNFVNLHLHSEASVGDSVIKIPQLIQQVDEYQQDYVAVTDHGSVANWYSLQKSCEGTNIKPLYGNEFYCKTTLDKPKDQTRYHIVCIAMSPKGAENINRMQGISLSHKYYKPLLPHQVLMTYTEDVFVSTACSLSYINQQLWNGNKDVAYDFLNALLDAFGKDNVAIELQYHPTLMLDGRYWQNELNNELIEMYDNTDVKWIINTFDSHCLLDKDRMLRRVLMHKNWKKPIDEINETLKSNVLGNTDLSYQFAHESGIEDDNLIQKCIDNTHKIAEKCYFDMPKHKRVIPHFDKHKEFKQIFLKKVF